MFRNREDAAMHLAQKLEGRPLHDPIILAIPRGGVVLGAVLARQLRADLDVLLVRKLRAPFQPELALGAVGEDGAVYLDPRIEEWREEAQAHLQAETHFQKSEIARRQKLFRNDRPPARVTGRSVIVTDDGIATGSTMIAALRCLSSQAPREIIVAVPVASPGSLAEISPLCDSIVCLLAPEDFFAVGQFYRDFRQVEDETVVELLQAHHQKVAAAGAV